MTKVLVAYASAHGSTAEIANAIGGVLKERGLESTVMDVRNVNTISGYDAFVLGSAVHTGSWLPEMKTFVKQFIDTLTKNPIYFWMSCIRVLEQHGEEHALTHYMVPDLTARLNPRLVTALAGRLDLESTDWNERWTLAARYDGVTWPSNFDGDFRDWEVIRAWAGRIADDLGQAG